jgi:hypothetical protein
MPHPIISLSFETVTNILDPNRHRITIPTLNPNQLKIMKLVKTLAMAAGVILTAMTGLAQTTIYSQNFGTGTTHRRLPPPTRHP